MHSSAPQKTHQTSSLIGVLFLYLDSFDATMAYSWSSDSRHDQNPSYRVDLRDSHQVQGRSQRAPRIHQRSQLAGP